MKYLIHYMLSLKCEQPCFTYITYLFSKVKLRLGQKFSQFIHRFNVGIFLVLVLGCTSKFFPINKEILGFLNVALARLLIFPNSWKRWKIKHFEYKPRLHFQIFPNSLKS